MFGRRSRRNPASVVPLLVVFAVVLFKVSCDSPRPPAPVVHHTAPAPRPSDPLPIVNPIEQLLTPPDGAKSDAIAVVLLVDTSGSMVEDVRDKDGGLKPKIVIARRCTLNLVRQMEQFCAQNREKKILLGIYEFSGRDSPVMCRQVVPLGAPSVAASKGAVEAMQPHGSTPIGDAMIAAKQALDRTGLKHMHILVVTDGDNTLGYNPSAVADFLSRQPAEHQAYFYFVAFDVSAEKFLGIRNAGGTVLSASNEAQLQQSLDNLLTGRILAEQPEPPK